MPPDALPPNPETMVFDHSIDASCCPPPPPSRNILYETLVLLTTVLSVKTTACSLKNKCSMV